MTRTPKDFPIKKWERKEELVYKEHGWIYNWFSNFGESLLKIDGKHYGSVENYYQACKAEREEDHEMIRKSTAAASKKLGRKVPMRKDWEEIKVQVMQKALRVKWSQPQWRAKLLATGTSEIIEWNNWSDDTWGVTIKNNTGRNILGILLMEIREALKEAEQITIKPEPEAAVPLFTPNHILVGHITNDLEWANVRVQVKQKQLEGYYILVNGLKYKIDLDGRCSYSPFKLNDTLLMELL